VSPVSSLNWDPFEVEIIIMKNIENIIERFASELRGRLGKKILGIYLYGSIAKGTATDESDIDILVVYSDLDERSLLEMASEVSFKIVCDEGRIIETIPMSKEEFEQSLGRSPFLWEVLKFGKPIFTNLFATEWKLDFKDYLGLA
jgi:predicted nucleotidyltransferase